MKKTDNKNKSFSYELGQFTWKNPDNADGQVGWELNREIMDKIADGTIRYFFIALNAAVIKTSNTMGGIEIIVNSKESGFCKDDFSFKWNWDNETKTGGWISYNDLLNESCSSLDSDIIYLRYDITSHPSYDAIKEAMSCAAWGQFAIQYCLGIKNLPFVNGYFG
jgi:hypothetical protein